MALSPEEKAELERLRALNEDQEREELQRLREEASPEQRAQVLADLADEKARTTTGLERQEAARESIKQTRAAYMPRLRAEEEQRAAQGNSRAGAQGGDLVMDVDSGGKTHLRPGQPGSEGEEGEEAQGEDEGQEQPVTREALEKALAEAEEAGDWSTVISLERRLARVPAEVEG